MRINSIEGFVVSDTDTAGDPAYYGYLSSDGRWYIMQETKATGAYRFASGNSGYAAAWAGRGGLTYVLFNGL